MRVYTLPMALLLLSLSSCTEPNPYLGVCGNGVHEPDFDEECDDGAGNGDAKACSMTCRIATCGDGVVQPSLGEECDLGDQNSNNGSCTLDCQFAQCGDGLLQPGEACDDANANRWPADGEPGCSIYCAPLPYCGDGSTDPDLDEECDDANDVDDDACTNDCKATTCGDGVVQGAEECDDANEIDTDGCTNACRYAVCGDGVVLEGKEECDDGNDVNNDACLNVCLLAVCGDGVLHEGVEECDDGNLVNDDGCNAACLRDRKIFVTKDSTEAGELGGLAGADAMCQAEAADAGLEGAERFKAWLSDSNNSPSTRFVTREARYVLVDGSLVADDWNDLIDGQLSHPIDRHVDGTPANSVLWTATLPNGDAADNGSFCANWTETELMELVEIGSTQQTGTKWTFFEDFPSYCSDVSRLYCFED